MFRIPVYRLETCHASGRNASTFITPVGTDIIHCKHGSEIEDGTAPSLEQISRCYYGCRTVRSQIFRNRIMREHSRIHKKETVTDFFEPCKILLGKLPYTAEHQHFRPFLIYKGQDEIKHSFTLISECLAESHPVSPGSFQSCISYVDYKISHYSYLYIRANLRN